MKLTKIILVILLLAVAIEAFSNPVDKVSISVGNREYSFEYFTEKDCVLKKSSASLHDSLLINEVYYYNVVTLNDTVQTIYLAKDYGLVQIIEADVSAWTLNECKNN